MIDQRAFQTAGTPAGAISMVAELCGATARSGDGFRNH